MQKIYSAVDFDSDPEFTPGTFVYATSKKRGQSGTCTQGEVGSKRARMRDVLDSISDRPRKSEK